MAVCFILFFALNPVYSIFEGIYAGKDIKRLWILPVATAIFFLVGAWLFFDMGEKIFIIYALGYLVLGIAAMLITMLVRRRA